jgi:hypothetical protein
MKYVGFVYVHAGCKPCALRRALSFEQGSFF